MSADKPTILIVDAAQDNIQALTSILREDFEIRCIADVSKAIENARDEQPHQIIVNASLPGSDGFGVCARFKAEPRLVEIPVLLLLPSGRGAEVDKAVAAGAADFITLPVESAVARLRVFAHSELKQYRDFLKSMAHIDGLTGVANRRQFDESLEIEWRRNLRNAEPLSLLLIDMDRLKAFNEYYGPAAGDECLKSMAAAMDSAVQRPGDFLARYSGGKFACMLPETDNIGAVSVAERMRAEVASLAIPHESSEVSSMVTVSIGVATIVPIPEKSPEELLMVAEHRLLDAKDRGRNRIEFS